MRCDYVLSIFALMSTTGAKEIKFVWSTPYNKKASHLEYSLCQLHEVKFTKGHKFLKMMLF